MKILKPILLLFFSQLGHSGLAQAPSYAPARVIVKFAEGVLNPSERKLNIRDFDLTDLDVLNSKYGLVYAERLYKGQVTNPVSTGVEDISRIYVLHFADTFAIEEVINIYKGTDFFEYVEPDFKGQAAVSSTAFEPDDPYFDRQWYLYNDATFTLSPSTLDADIDMELAWEKQKGKSSVTLAIMDSGMKTDHPEFENRFWVNKVEIPGNGKDDDYNGYIDDINGYDFAYGDSDPADDHGHGTAMAGLAAANGNNTTGFAGVDWNCKIMNLKVLQADGFGYYSFWAEALFYAVDHGADVINMSLVGSSSSELLTDGIKYTEANHVLVVAAMGNDNSSSPGYPAAIKDCFAVGASDSDDGRSSSFLSSGGGSNFGNHIDVVAPGNYIYLLDYINAFEYGFYGGGTSMSTALVSGVASLLKAQDPTRAPEQIRDILRNTADDMVGAAGIDGPGWDPYHGYGRLNANSALSASISSETAVLTEGVDIFPNPTSGEFKVVFRLFQDSDVQITFYNRIGAIVRNVPVFEDIKAGTQSLTLSLNHVLSGVYYMKFEHDEGSELKKIVVF